jgi:MerR family transcriptional regulator, light-induced transcriptional regulator
MEFIHVLCYNSNIVKKGGEKMEAFSTRLRKLRKSRHISQKDLAKVLGLAQTTIANYEQGTRFPDERLLHSLADYFHVSLDYLLGRSDTENNNSDWLTALEHPLETSTKENLELIANQFIEFVMSGEKQLASRLILNRIKNGTSVKDIYIHVFEKTLKRIGDLWEAGRLDVAAEHHFTCVTRTILAQLHPYLYNPKRIPLTVVSLSVSGEMHNIGMRMVTDLLEMEGINTVFLGSNIPTDSIIRTLKHWKASVLAISATMDYHVNSVKTLIDAVRGDEECKNVKVVVGGAAFNIAADLWKKVGADAYAANAEEAVDVIKDFELPQIK